MPSGKPIDWSELDQKLKSDLPGMTIIAWQHKYAPLISPKAIGARAKKLNIIPGTYKPTQAHKDKISRSIIGDEKDLAEQIKNMRDDYSNREIIKMLNLDDATYNRIIKRNNIVLSEIGKRRALLQMKTCGIGKPAWNKGIPLTTDTKIKISNALKGPKNAQYGKKLSEKQLAKRAIWFKQYGMEKSRLYHLSDKAKEIRSKTIEKLRTPEYREKASMIATERSKLGL